MTQILRLGMLPALYSVVNLPTQRGRSVPAASAVFGRTLLPTDAIDISPINIVNAVTGSRYRIEVVSTGVMVAEGDVASGDFTVNVPLYPAGNAANSLKVKVRRGTSAPKFKPFETQVTAVAAGALAYVAQEPDPIS